MKRRISGGIYLVVDPAMEEEHLLQKLKDVLRAEVAAVQLWNNFAPGADKQHILSQIWRLCHERNVPVLVNDDLDLLRNSEADGIHFDDIPEDLEIIKQLVPGKIIGITCNNDLSVIERADRQELDYISFCSVFPSGTSNSCDLVNFDNIRKSRSMTSMPLFVAGGINPENMQDLQGLDIDGVAVISGIMGSSKPSEATEQYQTELKKIKYEKRNHQ